MDGPELSHLLDGADTEQPSSEVLDCIVLRHRRQRARRARVAASLGLVMVIAGLGVGIGLNDQGGTTRTATGGAQFKPDESTPPKTTFPPASVGMNASNKLGTVVGTAPRGLGWVATSFGSTVGSPVSNASSASVSTPASGLLRPTATSGPCTSSGCGSNWPLGSPTGAVLTHLFTRTTNGVTIRAFTASWTVAPLALVPVSSGPSTSASGESEAGSTASGAGTSSGVATSPPVSVATTSSDTPTTLITEPGPVVPSTSVVLPARCDITRALVVEVSDAGAVGTLAVPFRAAAKVPLDVLSDEVVGAAERSPITVVVAHTDGTVKAVRAEFAAGGQDEMSVLGGWAVLARPLSQSSGDGSASQGTATMSGQAEVYALSSDATVLEHADLPGSGALALRVAACYAPSAGVHKVSSSPASTAKASVGSSGSGSATPKAG